MTEAQATAVISFGEAFNKADPKRRVLLLGNGFSIAGSPRHFDYNSNESIVSRFRQKLIDNLSDTIKSVNSATPTSEKYMSLFESMQTEPVKGLKKLLIETIIKYHPQVPKEYDKDNTKQHACVDFLANFISPDSNGELYALNYDLLLYWAFMHSKSTNKIEFNDGFAAGPWVKDSGQNVSYMHGALYFAGQADESLPPSRLIRRKAPDQVVELMQQIKDNHDGGKSPFIVLESTGDKKLEIIKSNEYFKHCLEKFTATTNDKDVALFVFGCSLSEGDSHIRNAIQGGQCDVFIGLFNEFCDGAFCLNMQHTIPEGVVTLLSQSASNRISFFCSKSARVWDKPPP